MQERSNFIHIPQGLAIDYTALRRTYGNQADLIRDILMFIIDESMSSTLEDEITFTLKELCDRIGRVKDEMQRTLPEYRNCDDSKKPIYNGHCFDGAFENALYNIFTTPLLFDKRKFNVDGFELESIYLFTSIKAVYKNSGRREMRTYSVKLDNRIRLMLLNRFFLFDMILYQKIRVLRSRKLTAGLRNFYLHMAYMVSITRYKIKEEREERRKKGVEEGKIELPFILTVDQISEIMGMSIERNDHRKRKVKESLDKLKEFLGNEHFEYVFTKDDNHNFEYIIEFSFPEKTYNHYNYQENKENTDTSFFISFGISIYNLYYKTHISSEQAKFYIWRKGLNLQDHNDIAKWFFDKKPQNCKKVSEAFKKLFREIYIKEYDGRFGEIE